MKKKLSLLLPLIALFALLFTACKGDKTVESMSVSGLKTEYVLNETVDFSTVMATVSYNDGSSEEVEGSNLAFSQIDTSIIGTQQLSISYGGFTITVSIKVNGLNLDGTPFDPSEQYITAVSLPESLALWENSKNDFVNQNYGYVVGDDNPFFFTLKLSVYSANGDKLNISSYTSVSNVFLSGSDVPLSGKELDRYVSINEEKNSFDFTEEAIGMTFTITTRPRDGVKGIEEEMSESFTVTVVDGYNIYEAYELNYITNSNTGFSFSEVDANEARNQSQIVNDFLLNEKGVTRPENINNIVLHCNLTIRRTDIPAEYFYNKDRNNDLYDFLAVFNHETTESNKSFTIHGNYFAIYSYELPCIVSPGVANQNNQVSNGMLFKFVCGADKDKNFDHTKYSVNLKNLMLVDDDPQSDDLESSQKAMLGLIAMKTYDQIINLDNIKIQSFYISLISEEDYQTININECVFYNSWQNHIHLISCNDIQENDDEPLPKEEYPRLTVNITKTTVSQSGGPAIIMQTLNPSYNKNKYAGAVVNISEDSVVESWVTGEEAWFKALQIESIAQMIKNFDKNVNSLDSSFIKEEIRLVNGTPTNFKLVNIAVVNLMVPDLTQSVTGIFSQLQGKIDIDGKVVIGNKAVMDMDDYVYDGVSSNYGDPAVSNLKSKNSSNHVLLTENGVACVGPDRPFEVEEGTLAAQSENEYLTIFFYTLGLVIGNYHPMD